MRRKQPKLWLLTAGERAEGYHVQCILRGVNDPRTHAEEFSHVWKQGEIQKSVDQHFIHCCGRDYKLVWDKNGNTAERCPEHGPAIKAVYSRRAALGLTSTGDEDLQQRRAFIVWLCLHHGYTKESYTEVNLTDG